MTVKYYEWGQTAGGGGDQPAVPADALYGPPEQFSGTVTNAGATITFTSNTKWVHVINTDVAENLQVSFDGGANYITIVSGGDLKENVSISSLVLLGAAGGTDYEISAALMVS